ncbi:Hsp20/alpha crystallin family protein [Patescibacteria group bacterium]
MMAVNKTPKSIKEVSEKKHKLFGSDDDNKEDKPEKNDEDWFSDYEGQLAVDVYQTPSEIVIKAPIAGVKPEEIEVSIAEDVVTIKGERQSDKTITKENYYYQECYWGTFSRSIVLPVAADTENSNATFKNGILTLTIPKEAKAKTKTVKVKTVQ